MATYLVTGGAGFIGSNIVHTLVAKRQRVVVLDNLSTGRRENLADVRAKIRFVKGDIRDLSTVRAACRGVDYLLHQAALRAVERSVDDPGATNAVNVDGTVNVLVAARETKVRRVVFASSSSVYGSQRAARNVETLRPAPESPYAVSKLAAEEYGRVFSSLYDLGTVSLRYFNVFGPYQRRESQYATVIPIFVDNLLRGVRPEVHWTGKQSRDFTYVDNVVRANLQAATSRSIRPGEVYNIGNGENATILELLAELQRLLGTSLKPRFAPKRPGDVWKTYADISKARRDFGYRPSVSFAEGLRRSIAWYKHTIPVS